MDFHMYAEPGEEAFRCLQGEFFRILDHTANIVGETAVSIGDIA